MALASHAMPLVVLNKVDLNPDWEALVTNTQSRLSVSVPIIATSIQDNLGRKELLTYLSEGTTSVFVGSSGVGKSSLINMLQQKEIVKTGEISSVLGKGKHTTTHRELIQLESGGIVIDTPGMRELFMWDADEAVDELFTPISELAKSCHFKNCSHTSEPGCAVIDALENGDIDEDTYHHYIQLKGEQKKFSNSTRKKKPLPEKVRHKKFSKQVRQVIRDKERWY
jgi:ribosome biogenesis GTPase